MANVEKEYVELKNTTTKKLEDMANLNLADYVTEEKSVPNWEIRKWNSGKVELWGTRTATADGSNWEAWGGIVAQDNAFPPFSFPITFKEPPYEIVTLSKTVPDTAGAWTYQNENATTTKSGAYGILRGTPTSTQQFSINVYVVGEEQKA